MSTTKHKKKPSGSRIGRPPLGSSAKSVIVQTRVRATLAARLAQDAATRGKTVSERVREILEGVYR